MLKLIDRLLDRITMYRLVIYYLLALLVAAVGLSWGHYLQYNPIVIAFSAGYLTLLCWLSNLAFAKVYKAPVSNESWLITALILALIVPPLHGPHDILYLTAFAGLAMASKFVLAIRHQHIFNPAAVAAVLMALGPHQPASWWVGSLPLLPFVVVGGLLVIRKIQHGQMVTTFVAVALGSTILANLLTHHSVFVNLKATVLHSSLFFLAFIMLPEPATSPTTEGHRRWYAVLTGVLFPPQVHLLSLYSTPELALVAGNIYSYVVGPKAKLLPRLLRKERIGSSAMDFVFETNRPLRYRPGQYMEWTLPHGQPDNRGNRRYLTLASSPTEKDLRIGVKFYPKGSTYKAALLAMNSQTAIAAGQLGGDFTLPHDPQQKLVLIAGGIGITPFRSMLKYLIDTRDKRSVTLMYSEAGPKDFAYTDIFETAKHQLSTKLVYTITGQAPADWTGHTGYITTDMIRSSVPDFKERVFYISGPHSMVTAVQDNLRQLDVPSHQIKTDFFPGYA